MKLALGTVQFGLAYGVVGRDEPIGDTEARSIFSRALALGIDTLDTAPAYGDIEQRLASLVGGDRFSVVTKIPTLSPVSGDDAVALVHASLQRSRQRLGDALRVVLFHDASDLLAPDGDRLWDAASSLTASWGVQLGVSCYDPAQLQTMLARWPVAVAQLPGNVFDQRLQGYALPGVEIHLRSAFLQGLLLAPVDEATARVPAATAALERWHSVCAQRAISPLAAALGAVKAMPGVARCVVGVDSASHLEQIAAAWDSAEALAWPALAVNDLAVIDPRTWRPK